MANFYYLIYLIMEERIYITKVKKLDLKKITNIKEFDDKYIIVELDDKLYYGSK